MRDPDAKRFVEAVPRIAGLLGAAEPGRGLGMGERAALRRLDPAAPEGGIGDATPQSVVDSLLQTDHAFADRARARTPQESVLDMLADSALMPLPTGTFARGKDAVRTALATNRPRSGASGSRARGPGRRRLPAAARRRDGRAAAPWAPGGWCRA
jgi:hypothetical protein